MNGYRTRKALDVRGSWFFLFLFCFGLFERQMWLLVGNYFKCWVLYGVVGAEGASRSGLGSWKPVTTACRFHVEREILISELMAAQLRHVI